MPAGAEPVKGTPLRRFVRPRVERPGRSEPPEPIAPRIREPQPVRHSDSTGGIDVDQGGKAAQRVGFRLDRDHHPEAVEPARFGQDRRKHTILLHHLDRGHGVAGFQQFDELLHDALSRQRRQAIGGGSTGSAGVRITGASPETGLEPVIAQQPEHILADPSGGIADKANPARVQIGQAAHRIINRPIGIEKNCVYGEITPRCVGGPVRVKSHTGAPAIGFDIPPQRRDLEPPGRRPGHGRDRPMIEPSGHHFDPGLLEEFDDALGLRRGREVDVADRAAQQRVANRTADEARFHTACPQRREHRQGRRFGHPGLRSNPGHVSDLR